jgi:hypothetical protein
VQQGSIPTTVGNAWPVKLTDGTNTTAVKAASTAPIATDPAAVVVQSPNGNHATAANQATEITSLQLIDNPVGSSTGGTAGTSSFDAGGIYNSTAPTLTNGQQASLQLSSTGALITDDSTAPGVPHANRVDVTGAKIASGNSGSLDSRGFAQLSAHIDFSSFTGSTPTVQVHLQVSDDNSNWLTIMDTPKVSSAQFFDWGAVRLSHKWYRFAWDITGSTPSVTVTINTTLKAVQTSRYAQQFFYSDLDLTVNGNMSSTFSARDCKNITVLFIRGADGGNNGTVQLFASIDKTNWISQSGNLAANPSTVNDASISNASWPYWNIQVTAHTSVGTRVLDIQWSCN